MLNFLTRILTKKQKKILEEERKNEKILTVWKYGLVYLFSDELNSFYVFFTLIFAACAWVASNCNLNLALPSIIILLGYIANTMIFSWLKGNAEGTRKEKVFCVCYIAVFIILSLIGCILNVKYHLIIMAIILGVTFLAFIVRKYLLGAFLQCVFGVAPIIILTYFIAKLPQIHMLVKNTMIIVYVFCVPFIADYEDSSAAQNIFELAYVNTWDYEFEKRMRKLQNSDKDKVV